MTDTVTTIEIFEDHEVTASALDVNIGSGLRDAMRIAPEVFRTVVGDGPGAKAVRKLLDKHAAEVAKHRELDGQGSLLDNEDDEALADKEARLAAEEAGDDFYDSEGAS